VRIALVTGGARAGKSRWAQREALALGGDDVGVVATAEPLDDEMADRIARHRAERPSGWATIEEPLDVAAAVAACAHSVVVLDCLTVWMSNLLHQPPSDLAAASDRALEAVERLLAAADRRPDGDLIVVTNEVGMGLVPGDALSRAYRDTLGRANARVAARAERVVLLVAGLPVTVR